jgi:hypothetical protein
LGVLDRLLLALLAGSVVLALRSLEDVWSQAFLSVLAATMLMGSWVGVVGVNFRYQLPSLIPACIVLMCAARDYATATRSVARPKDVTRHHQLRTPEPALPFHPRVVEDIPSSAPAVARKALTAR